MKIDKKLIKELVEHLKEFNLTELEYQDGQIIKIQKQMEDMQYNAVNIKRLQEDMKEARENIEKLKDKIRETNGGH